jgi:hypothetical protein
MARWVQTHVLAQYPSAQLSVYVVWLPMLWGDAREEWNGTTLPDPRAIHFWDTVPAPLAGSGGTIIREREKLEMEVSAWMKR